MKNIPRICAPWRAVIMLGLAGVASVQALELRDALPARQAVTEGRNVTLYAEYATGSVQWQVAPKGSGAPAWTAVAEGGVYHGANTRSLEIHQVTADLDGVSYRFIDTTAGVVTASNTAKLAVTPLLLPQPAGIMLDGADGLVVADASTHTIRRIANALSYASGTEGPCPTGVAAGVTGEAGSDDGVADVHYGATFSQPNGIVAAAGGAAPAIAVADTANGTIRVINGQAVETLAGSATLRGNVDGAGRAARFAAPIGIARGPDGAYYVADSGNHTIRKVTAAGVVSTFAGGPGNAGFADGPGPQARFNNPTGIAVAADGVVYVADTNNNLIRQITPAGVVTTLAGVAGVAGAQDGPGGRALFNGPTGLVIGNNGIGLFLADTGNSTIRFVNLNNADRLVSTYAGVPGVAGLQEGHGYSYFDMLLDHPRALAYSPAGVLFIADTGNAAIRAIPQYDGVSTTLSLVDVPPQPSAPSTPPANPVVPPPPAPAASTTGGSSGGGACSEWFLAALAGLGFLRKLSRDAAPVTTGGPRRFR